MLQVTAFVPPGREKAQLGVLLKVKPFCRANYGGALEPVIYTVASVTLPCRLVGSETRQMQNHRLNQTLPLSWFSWLSLLPSISHLMSVLRWEKWRCGDIMGKRLADDNLTNETRFPV